MNNKLFTVFFLLALSFFVSNCSDNQDANLTPSLPTNNSQSATAPVTVLKFDAPANSGIDEQKAKQYANASAALLILGEEWSTKIEKAEGEKKVVILKNYEEARDQVCSRMGLKGIAEYNWITNVAAKDSSNVDVFSKAGIRL